MCKRLTWWRGWWERWCCPGDPGRTQSRTGVQLSTTSTTISDYQISILRNQSWPRKLLSLKVNEGAGLCSSQCSPLSLFSWGLKEPARLSEVLDSRAGSLRQKIGVTATTRNFEWGTLAWLKGPLEEIVMEVLATWSWCPAHLYSLIWSNCVSVKGGPHIARSAVMLSERLAITTRWSGLRSDGSTGE